MEGVTLPEEFVRPLRCLTAFLSNLFSLSGRLPVGGDFLDDFH